LSFSVDAVGQWLLQHIEEIFEKYPELKKKIIEKVKEELGEKLAAKTDIMRILEEIKRLREDFNRQQRQIEGLMEEIKRLREDFNRQQRQIEGLMEEIKRLREDFNRLSERLDFKISALGARWGLMSERAFREGLRLIVEKYFGGTVRRWVYYDERGFVYGKPSEIDVDVLVRDKEHLLIEVKAHVDKGDVAEFYRKGLLYEEVNGVRPRLIIISPFVRQRAMSLAAKLGIEIITEIPE